MGNSAIKQVEKYTVNGHKQDPVTFWKLWDTALLMQEPRERRADKDALDDGEVVRLGRLAFQIMYRE